LGEILYDGAANFERESDTIAAGRTVTPVTRDQQIRAALALLAPPAPERSACRAHIEIALKEIDRVLDLKVSSKDATNARSAYHRALLKLQSAHNALVAAGGFGFFKLGDIGRAIEATKTGRVYYADPPGPISAELRIEGLKTRKAAELAHELIARWRAGEEIVTTRHRTWWKLAAILYGDAGADLYQHLRAVKYAQAKNKASKYLKPSA
jgi:hypothetical protein